MPILDPTSNNLTPFKIFATYWTQGIRNHHFHRIKFLISQQAQQDYNQVLEEFLTLLTFKYLHHLRYKPKIIQFTIHFPSKLSLELSSSKWNESSGPTSASLRHFRRGGSVINSANGNPPIVSEIRQYTRRATCVHTTMNADATGSTVTVLIFK
jgi:hypothetical protein